MQLRNPVIAAFERHSDMSFDTFEEFAEPHHREIFEDLCGRCFEEIKHGDTPVDILREIEEDEELQDAITEIHFELQIT